MTDCVTNHTTLRSDWETSSLLTPAFTCLLTYSLIHSEDPTRNTVYGALNFTVPKVRIPIKKITRKV